jgi:hypothetical protein
MVVFCSAVISLFWPLAPLVPVAVGIWRWVSGSKIRANAEIEADMRAMDEKVRDLEKKLGMR